MKVCAVEENLSGERLMPSTLLALDLGCGDKLYQDNHPKGNYRWVGLDKYDFSYLYRPREFIQHDLSRPLPFPDGTVDLVWCHHVLEHLPPRHPEVDQDFVVFLVNEVGRVLKPRCAFHIVVPWVEHTNAWRAPHHYRFFNHEIFRWFSYSERLEAEHLAAGLQHKWRVTRNDVIDQCHVYAILELLV